VSGKLKPNAWSTQTMSARILLDSDRALGLYVVSVGTDGWIATVLEMGKPPPAAQKDPVKFAESVFDDHAHEVVGKFKTERAAKRAADKRGREWLAARSKAGATAGPALDPCPCGPLTH
jgi:hypothetical protein